VFIKLYQKTGSGGFEGQVGRLWWSGHLKLLRLSVYWDNKNGNRKLLFQGPFYTQRKIWFYARSYGASKRMALKAVLRSLK
jgi:hypothetical protein